MIQNRFDFLKNPAILAFALNVFFLAGYFVFGIVRYGGLDDYFMSGVLTGAYGSVYDVHLYFINAIFAYVLKPFFWLFPNVGWFYFFEIFEVFASLFVITFIFIRRSGVKWGGLLSFFLLACIAPDFYSNVNFTQCATILTAAGVLLLAVGDVERKKGFIFGSLFFLIGGYVMRSDAFMIAMPFACVLLFSNFLDSRKIYWKTLLTVLLCMFAIWGLKSFNRNLYQNNEYSYYAAYQGPRAFFGDGRYYDGESTYDELEERGMQGRDFYHLQNWDFYDTDVFCLDSINAIAKVVRRNMYVPNKLRMPAAFVIVLSNAFSRMNAWCWAVLCIFLILFSNKKSRLYPWVSLGIVGMCIGYLLLVNRVVYHVETGIWLCATTAAIAFMPRGEDFFKGKASKYQRVAVLGLALVSVAFIIMATPSHKETERRGLVSIPELSPENAAFLDYARNHPNDVFLMAFEPYKRLAETKDAAYKVIPPGSWDNIIPIGYWNIHLPQMKKELAKRGVQNPLRDIVKENVYVIEDSRANYLHFYETHYHKKLVVDTVLVLGESLMFKYREDGADDEKDSEN